MTAVEMTQDSESEQDGEMDSSHGLFDASPEHGVANDSALASMLVSSQMPYASAGVYPSQAGLSNGGGKMIPGGLGHSRRRYRGFRAQWVHEFEWIIYDSETYKVHCRICKFGGATVDFAQGKDKPNGGWRREYLMRHMRDFRHTAALEKIGGELPFMPPGERGLNGCVGSCTSPMFAVVDSKGMPLPEPKLIDTQGSHTSQPVVAEPQHAQPLFPDRPSSRHVLVVDPRTSQNLFMEPRMDPLFPPEGEQEPLASTSAHPEGQPSDPESETKVAKVVLHKLLNKYQLVPKQVQGKKSVFISNFDCSTPFVGGSRNVSSCRWLFVTGGTVWSLNPRDLRLPSLGPPPPPSETKFIACRLGCIYTVKIKNPTKFAHFR